MVTRLSRPLFFQKGFLSSFSFSSRFHQVGNDELFPDPPGYLVLFFPRPSVNFPSPQALLSIQWAPLFPFIPSRGISLARVRIGKKGLADPFFVSLSPLLGYSVPQRVGFFFFFFFTSPLSSSLWPAGFFSASFTRLSRGLHSSPEYSFWPPLFFFTTNPSRSKIIQPR